MCNSLFDDNVLGEEYDELYETIVGVSEITENTGWFSKTYIWTGQKKIENSIIPNYSYSYYYGFYRFKYNSRRREVKVYTIMYYSNSLDMIIPLINTNYSIDVNRDLENIGMLRTHYMYSYLDYLIDDKYIFKPYNTRVPIFYKEPHFDTYTFTPAENTCVFCPVLIDTRKGLLFGMKFLLHLFGGHFPVIKTFYKYLSNYNEPDIDYYMPQLDYFETNIIPIEFPFICNSINHLYKFYKDGLLNVGYYHHKYLILLTEDAYNTKNEYYAEIFGSVRGMIKYREEYIYDFFKDI